MNFPNPFHGDNTWATSPPVLPAAKAAGYAGSVIDIRAAPNISMKQMGTKRPKNVNMNTLTGDVSTGSLQL